jgi:hypothetical protein
MERNKREKDAIGILFGDDPKREAFQREVSERVRAIGVGLEASVKDAVEVCDDLYRLSNADAARLTDDDIREAFKRSGITKVPN